MIQGVETLFGVWPVGNDDHGRRLMRGHHLPDSVASQGIGAAEDRVGGFGGGDHDVLVRYQHTSQLVVGLARKTDQQNFRHAKGRSPDWAGTRPSIST